MARIDAHPTDFDHWDIWYAWEEASSSATDGKSVTGWKEDGGYVVSARSLTDLDSKKKLVELSKELIGYLERDISPSR